MYTIKNILISAMTFILMSSCNAITNSKTETHKVYGNCGMCKKTIEKAVAVSKTAKGEWNKETKILSLTFDSTKTNSEEILKRVGLAGYDSELFYAPDDTYTKLPTCCQYDRRTKPSESAKTKTKSEQKTETVATTPIASTPVATANTTQAPKAEINPLNEVVNAYYDLKNALVKTDGKSASLSAKKMLNAIASVKMESLTEKEHSVWMKIMSDIKSKTESIEKSKDIASQRKQFSPLSQNIYMLVKSMKSATPAYYQHCPMAFDSKGANWLSREKAVKNPYYGSMMLNCGSVVETIK